MANEPERPIEQLLHAAAKKRREEAGAPLELHPATRRLLQGEVARTHAGAGREGRSFFQSLRQLWPRLAWGLGVFAVLVVTARLLITAWPMRPGQDEDKAEARLAKNYAPPQATPAKKPLQPSPAAEEAAHGSTASKSKAESGAVAFAQPAQSMPSTPARRALVPPPADQPQPAPADALAEPLDNTVREKRPSAAPPIGANRYKTAEAEVVAPSEAPAPARATAASGAFDEVAKSIGRPASLASAPPAPASPAPATAAPAASAVADLGQSSALGVKQADRSGYGYNSGLGGGSANAPRAAAAPASGLLVSAAATRKDAKSASTSQWFAQAPQGPKLKLNSADKAAAAHPVLASFQLEQSGRELRIVDGDGSVYSGYLQLANAFYRQRATGAEAAPATRATQALGGVLADKAGARVDSDRLVTQAYSFSVTGTNRSLRKKVVFSGNLMAVTNAVLFQSGTNFLGADSRLAGFQDAPAQQRLPRLLPSRISGKLVIGNGKAVEINALPTSP